MLRLSIIIPLFNVERYLPMCLESVVLQLLEDYEVILVDDGSTDDSASICDQWAQMDNRFHVVRHGTNRTINKARETGFRHCTGSLVFNADPDDLLHPQAIEIQQALLSSHSECQMVAGPLTPYWGEIADFTPIVNPHFEVLDQTPSIRQRMLRGGNHTFWNKLYRRELMENIDWDVARVNDFHLSLQVWLNCSKIVHLNETTYYWIQRDLSATHANRAESSIKKFDTFIMDWNRYIGGKHPEYYSTFIYRCYTMATDGYNKLTDKKEKKAWREKLDELFELTWHDYITSDAPMLEKFAMCWVKRFPSMKQFFSKLKRIHS